MKCLVFSDSHGRAHFMEQALRSHPDAEAVFFLGDGLSDFFSLFDKMNSSAKLFVRGNCDMGASAFAPVAERLDRVNLLGKIIYFTHGDLYSVKAGTERLEAMAEARGADIVLFGHTHQPLIKYVDPSEKYEASSGEMSDNERAGETSTDPTALTAETKPYYLFNPGSVGSSSPTYGIMTLTENSVLFSHGRFL